ncbi:MAG: hypothetical protein AB7U65_02960 [Halothiobacillaceae bacterium]
MPNEYFLYAALAGMLIFGVSCLLTMSTTASWGLSFAAALAALYYFSPHILPEDSLFHLERDLTLLARDALFLLSWLAGSFLARWTCLRSQT